MLVGAQQSSHDESIQVDRARSDASAYTCRSKRDILQCLLSSAVRQHVLLIQDQQMVALSRYLQMVMLLLVGCGDSGGGTATTTIPTRPSSAVFACAVC